MREYIKQELFKIASILNSEFIKSYSLKKGIESLSVIWSTRFTWIKNNKGDWEKHRNQEELTPSLKSNKIDKESNPNYGEYRGLGFDGKIAEEKNGIKEILKPEIKIRLYVLQDEGERKSDGSTKYRNYELYKIEDDDKLKLIVSSTSLEKIEQNIKKIKDEKKIINPEDIYNAIKYDSDKKIDKGYKEAIKNLLKILEVDNKNLKFLAHSEKGHGQYYLQFDIDNKTKEEKKDIFDNMLKNKTIDKVIDKFKEFINKKGFDEKDYSLELSRSEKTSCLFKILIK